MLLVYANTNKQQLNYLHAGKVFMLLLSSADFFLKLTFSKKTFRNTIRVSNGLDLDQDRQNVGSKLFAKVISRKQVAASKGKVEIV